MVGDLHIRIAKLAFHAKESPIRTRDEVFNLVSSLSMSPAEDDSSAIRTPPSSGLPQGEHCIEIQKERRSHLANNYGPVGLW